MSVLAWRYGPTGLAVAAHDDLDAVVAVEAATLDGGVLVGVEAPDGWVDGVELAERVEAGRRETVVVEVAAPGPARQAGRWAQVARVDEVDAEAVAVRWAEAVGPERVRVRAT